MATAANDRPPGMWKTAFDLYRRSFPHGPDSANMHWSSQHRKAADVLTAALTADVKSAPAVVVTGPPGVGKTTLIWAVLNALPDIGTVGLLSSYTPRISSVANWLPVVFGLETDDEQPMPPQFDDFLQREAAAGRRVALVVDEAQNLTDADLETLCAFTTAAAPMQIVLVGQPELATRLAAPGAAGMNARITHRASLGPLSGKDVAAYIDTRIVAAGGPSGLFTEAAARVVHGATGGAPRLVNTLCELSLMHAAADDGTRRDGVGAIDKALVRRVLSGAAERGEFAALTEHAARDDAAETDRRTRDETSDAPPRPVGRFRAVADASGVAPGRMNFVPADAPSSLPTESGDEPEAAARSSAARSSARSAVGTEEPAPGVAPPPDEDPLDANPSKAAFGSTKIPEEFIAQVRRELLSETTKRPSPTAKSSSRGPHQPRPARTKGERTAPPTAARAPSPTPRSPPGEATARKPDAPMGPPVSRSAKPPRAPEAPLRADTPTSGERRRAPPASPPRRGRGGYAVAASLLALIGGALAIPGSPVYVLDAWRPRLSDVEPTAVTSIGGRAAPPRAAAGAAPETPDNVASSSSPVSELTAAPELAGRESTGPDQSGLPSNEPNEPPVTEPAAAPPVSTLIAEAVRPPGYDFAAPSARATDDVIPSPTPPGARAIELAAAPAAPAMKDSTPAPALSNVEPAIGRAAGALAPRQAQRDAALSPTSRPGSNRVNIGRIRGLPQSSPTTAAGQAPAAGGDDLSDAALTALRFAAAPAAPSRGDPAGPAAPGSPAISEAVIGSALPPSDTVAALAPDPGALRAPSPQFDGGAVEAPGASPPSGSEPQEITSPSLSSGPRARPDEETAVVAAPRSRPWVVVHYRAAAEARASAVAEALRRDGFPDVTLREVRFAVSSTNIRYFFADDRDLAMRLAAALADAEGARQTFAPRDFSSYDRLPAPQTLEIWLGG